MALDVQYIYRIKDEFTQRMNRISNSVKKFENNTQKAREKADALRGQLFDTAAAAADLAVPLQRFMRF